MKCSVQGVLCAGPIVLDTLVRPVDRMVWGTSTWVESIEQQVGGNGAVTSYALGRLGVPVRLLGWIGGDRGGRELLERVEAAGVDVSFVRRSHAPTAATVVLVNGRGERLFLHRPGASLEAFAESVPLSSQVLQGVSHLHLANLFALPHLRVCAADWLRRARGLGLSTSVDTGWDASGAWSETLTPCLEHTEILFINEVEACRLAGRDDPRSAAQGLLDLGARCVVLKRAAVGCTVFSSGGEIDSPAFVVPAVDSTGAGDCFAGGFLAAMHRNLSLEESARFANAVAAIKVQALGATSGIRSWEETRSWMAEASSRAPENRAG